MLTEFQQNNFLTAYASYDSVMPERDCPVCGSLQFKGYPQRVEVKCRRCKTLLLFEGDVVKPNLRAF